MADELPIPVDYTNIGYESLRDSMLALARARVPEWTDFSESDLGVLLVELFAYACDITLYYQTRIAGNLFPATSDEPAALTQLLRLIGYELRPPAPASANLRLAFDATTTVPPVTVPAGTQFFVSLPDDTQLTFESERAVVIQNNELTPADSKNLRYFFPLPVVEGTTQEDVPLAVSDGSANQLYALRKRPVIAGSVLVSVTDQTGVPVLWQEVETLATSSPADHHYVVQYDADGAAAVLFGDGLNGAVPPRGTSVTPVTIRARYRIGGGARGNVPAGTPFRSALAQVQEATNPQAAAGGMEREDFRRARTLAPRLFRAQERAVTNQDYVDLAMQVPGVGKARAVAPDWNRVVLYVAPSGQVAPPSELLVRDLLAYFESRRLLAAELQITGPRPVDIYLGAIIRAKPFYTQSDVRAAVERAVADYLAFDAVEFGQPIYLSKIYDVIQSLEYVSSLTVFKFSTFADPLDPNLSDVKADGVIELAPDELPRAGYRDNPDTPINPLNPSFRPPIFTIIQGGVQQ
ncbi:MAG TPA: putative baseplate assembly protein [Pyrinomonadaceae bacterium]|jgi:hypothetical protein